MGLLRRIVLARPGETTGEGGDRLIGSADVPLSEAGRAQMRRLAGRLGQEPFDRVVASPLGRSWRGASLLASSASVILEPDFRGIHMGRWEGLSRAEIEARDPVLHQAWASGAEDFEFPSGEARADFRARVGAALEGLLAAPIHSALLVVDHGVIRVIAEALAGEKLGDDDPAPGELLGLTRKPDGTWFRGRQSSNPPGVEANLFASAGPS